MNISLPEALQSFVDEQVASGGYDTSGEHARELVRKDQSRQRLRKLLLDGASLPPAPLGSTYFERRREQVRAHQTE